MTLKSFGTSFYTLIVERRLARYYPWLLTGLAVLYVLTFPITRVALWVTVPVAVARWLYYRRGGFLGGILAFPVNLFLIDAFQFKITWQSLTQLTNGILVGHVFILLMGTTIGHLRREIENLYHHIQRLSSQERILISVNMAVRDILESKDINDGYYRLLTHIANLFVADYGYLVRIGMPLPARQLCFVPPGGRPRSTLLWFRSLRNPP